MAGLDNGDKVTVLADQVMDNLIDQLLARARGPPGPRVDLDLGRVAGPLLEPASLLSRVNPFTVFDTGIQVFHAGLHSLGPELQHWNA